MRAISIFLNVILPGTGSIRLGELATGTTQLILFFLGWIMILTMKGIGPYAGAAMTFCAWSWGLVSAARADGFSKEAGGADRPVEIETHVIRSGDAEM
ncbi:hypothetical protein [Salipiger mucosus]|uniref:Uncharacterized protein n=1 Tax=Salipiger mucosus DSM 16094 TaxID=1123237 RepID=S9QR26_9RHOB|nr:hypothetical protein [Salipiger mucosus]EPX83861.1 hypothetical protein Salmuc_01636 [Salipiger mucosus DSM 16094]